MRTIIRPYQGFGPIDFGMSRPEVIARLGPPRRDDPNDREFVQYVDLGLQANFRPGGGGCFWISSFPPCEPEVQGIPLDGVYSEVEYSLCRAGYLLHIGRGVIEGWLRCDELGIQVTREDLDTQEIESVSAYTRNHYTDPDDDWVLLREPPS